MFSKLLNQLGFKIKIYETWHLQQYSNIVGKIQQRRLFCDGIGRRDPPPRSPTTTLCCPDTTCLYYMYHWRRTPLSLPRMPCHVRTPAQEWALSPHLSHRRLTTVIRGLIRGFINPRTSPGSLFLSHTSSDCWVGGDLVFSTQGHEYLWKWWTGEGSVNKLWSLSVTYFISCKM